MLFSQLDFGEKDATEIKREDEERRVGFTLDVKESEPIDLSRLFGNPIKTQTESQILKPPSTTLAQALNKLQATNPQPLGPKPTYECQSCINSLIPIEKNLVRMEAKMAAMVTMVKKRQNLKTMKQTPIIIPRGGGPSLASAKILPSVKQEVLENKIIKTHRLSPVVRTTPAMTKRLIFTPLAKPSVPGSSSSTPSPSLINQRLDPKREEAKFQVARSKFLQALLLFPGTRFSYGNFAKKHQEVVQKLTQKQIEEILEQLVDDSLLHQQDDEQPKTHPKTVYMKETAKYKLRSLKHYPVSLKDFIDSFDA